mgnify:CR=1 FL=1
MKIAAIIARVLLGLTFLVFGLNGFLHFIPNQPMPPGLMSQFLDAMVKSQYQTVVSFFEVVGAVPLLVGRYVPLGLTILGPIVVNILIFHFLLAPSGIPVALVTAVLWLIVFIRVRRAFAGLFVQSAPE